MNFRNLLSLALIFTALSINTGFINPDTDTLQSPPIEDWAFVEFLSHFEKVENTFSIGLDDLYKYQALKQSKKSAKTKAKKSKGTLSRMSTMKYIPELESRMFSRMGPPEVMPVARFYPNEKTIAIIYMTYQPFRRMSDMTFHLSFFDLKGNNLPTQKDADMEEFSFDLANVNTIDTQTFKISKDGYVWKNTYNNLWKDDINETGLFDNEIIGYDLTSTEVFKFNEKGAIEPAKEYPVDTKASLD